MIYTSRPVGTSARVCLLALLLAGAILWQDSIMERTKFIPAAKPAATSNSPLRDAPDILIRLPLSVMVQLLLDLRS